jgi:predicted small secreted protein
MPRIRKQTITEYAPSPLSLTNLTTLSGLVAAFFLFMPTGCSTVDGMGRDISASSRMVREWWNRDNNRDNLSRSEPFYMDASIEEDAR